ncbi:MAG: TlpA family protein disulfide reductase [Acidobacteriota bacterium]|nr:TlpA family protein disulfide reductase [Acidobacteriota bacterium]
MAFVTRVVCVALFTAAAAFPQASIVNAVRAAIAQSNLPAAEEMARAFQARTGPRPDLAAALSWIARAHFAAHDLDRADAFATEASQMATRFLAGRKLDADPWLPTAVGAAIEVHAQVLAARGDRAEAVAYLREQYKTFAATSIVERIGKNLNLLSLEGKPAPVLEAAQWVGSVRPPSLAALRGRPVLLFFWAHWCSDCKAEIASIANLRREFAPQRLAVVGPTRLYGYVQGGEDAPPQVERRYIEQVRGQFYGALADMPAPLSAANFAAYGASSTPTLVLIDRTGVVRWYHPGAAAEAEIGGRIREMLAK